MQKNEQVAAEQTISKHLDLAQQMSKPLEQAGEEQDFTTSDFLDVLAVLYGVYIIGMTKAAPYPLSHHKILAAFIKRLNTFYPIISSKMSKK